MCQNFSITVALVCQDVMLKHNHPLPTENSPAMLFKDSILIDAPAQAVWAYVGAPPMWPRFHEKASRCEPIGAAGRAGATYHIDFHMGDEVTPTRCEILDLAAGRKIELKSRLPTPSGRRIRQSSLTNWRIAARRPA